MIPLPESPTDRLKLADWLEIYALISPDKNSSRGDLESVLRTASLLEGEDAIEKKCLEVFREIEDRKKAAGHGYPFRLEGSVLRTSDWTEYPAYVFCLCLSYFGCNESQGSKSFPRRWFEHIARDAAQHYIGGEAVRFGSPRLKAELPTKFEGAIGEICRKLKEGEGYKNGGLSGRKDDGVDVVVWKHFPDELPGKLILFGNCASEADWEGSKRTELTPEAFCSDWMIDPPRCQIVKSLFIPHRVEAKRFLPHLRRAGIIFDRCRISYWSYFVGSTSAQKKGNRFFDYSPLVEWSMKQLQGGMV